MCCTHIFPFSQENPVGPERTKTDVYKCAVPIYFHFQKKKTLLDQKEQKLMFINVLYPYISIFRRKKSCWTRKNKNRCLQMCCTHIFPFSQENPVGPERTKTDVYKCAVPIYFHFHKKIQLDQKEQKLMFINVLYPYIAIFTRKSCWTRKNKNRCL